jgi:Fic family protein
MDPKRFRDSQAGRVRKTPGRYGFYTFIPGPIPRAIDLSSRTVLLLSEADLALGRLGGGGRLLPNPHLLVNPYLVREAVASSRIEGTQASISDDFDASAIGGSVSEPVREVQNYVAAMNEGLDLLETLPLSLRLVRQIHKRLLTGVRGAERRPGDFRDSPNWIGSPDNRPETAMFVPPPVDEMNDSLADWERFAHDEPGMPVLIQCALLHYQFETIHPFLDGNGRVGRLMIVFFLVWREALPLPLLYISSYFERHREEYYDRLQAVRERGEIEGWLQFFLRAVSEQATDAISRTEQLSDLRETYRRELARRTRSRAPEVVELLFQNPVTTIAYVAERLGITWQGARNLIQQLEDLEIIVETRAAARGKRRWLASGILSVLHD